MSGSCRVVELPSFTSQGTRGTDDTVIQDDTYTESYISTIGVDFVSCTGEAADVAWSRHATKPCVLFPQKIRTVELDGKVIKLQIVSCITKLQKSYWGSIAGDSLRD